MFCHPGDEGTHVEDVLHVPAHLVKEVPAQVSVQRRAEDDVGLRQLKPNFEQYSLKNVKNRWNPSLHVMFVAMVQISPVLKLDPFHPVGSQ